MKTAGAHLVLFQLVPAEDNNLGGLVLPQHDFDKFLSKRTGSTGHQDNLIFPLHGILH